MKICVIGAYGQLGQALINENMNELIPLGHKDIEITNRDNVLKTIGSINPNVVINCAAYSAVDQAESEPDLCRKVNAIGSGYIAEGCEQNGAQLIYLSTDYVFSGTKTTPYKEEDVAKPLQVYGATKLEGEQLASKYCSKALVIRTSWLYSAYSKNFLKTILKKAINNKLLKVVNDQIGSPTKAEDIVATIFSLAKNVEKGIFHYSGEGSCTWYQFAKAVIKGYDIPCDIIPCKTGEFPVIAPRPAYSYLDKSLIRDFMGIEVACWQESLERFIWDNPMEKIMKGIEL